MRHNSQLLYLGSLLGLDSGTGVYFLLKIKPQVSLGVIF